MCVDSYVEAEELARSGHLVQAKEALADCTRAQCDGAVMKKCAALATTLDAGRPSIVPDKKPTAAVASIALTPTESKKDDKADDKKDDKTKDETDDAEEAAPVEAAGKSAPVQVHPDARPEGRRVWPVYALAGVGALGLGGAALLNHWGRQDNSTLKLTCGTNCNPDSVHHIRMVYLAADVAVGVGVAALTAAAWLYVRSQGSAEKASPRVAHISGFDVQPTATGAVASVGGVF